jgi:hypothetical protein
MGPGILVPVVIVLVVVPVVFWWARTRLQASGAAGLADSPDPSIRLTSNALRGLPAPPWRVVHEIAVDKLGGIEHVLVGPAGIFALRTSMQPLPAPASATPDAHAIGRAAIVRGALDDALRRCAMSSTSLVTVHWGVNPAGSPAAVDVLPGSVAVDGRSIAAWAASFPAAGLTPAQVDLAWQTVVVAIGRPDPLA